jgi:hypothetical protein
VSTSSTIIPMLRSRFDGRSEGLPWDGERLVCLLPDADS